MDHSPKPSIRVKQQIVSVSSDDKTLNPWLPALLSISSDLSNDALVLKFYPR